MPLARTSHLPFFSFFLTGPDGQLIDPGTGRKVADFLVTRTPTCPVIISTTNALAASAMADSLRGAGWETHRGVPFEDVRWIQTDWCFAIRRVLVGPVRQDPCSGSRP